MNSLEVSKFSGASLRQLQYWDTIGILCPKRKGHYVTNYTRREALAAKMIVGFRRKGVPLESIRMFIRPFLFWTLPRSKRWFAITAGHMFSIETDPARVIEIFAAAPAPAFLLDLP